MPMSRITMLLILAASSASAQPRMVTAEEGLEIHRRTSSALPQDRCEQATDAEEIMVCGKPGSPYRLPMPIDPPPGQRIAGETPSALAATKEASCTNIGHTRGCPSLDLLGVAALVGKAIVGKVVEHVREDE